MVDPRASQLKLNQRPGFPFEQNERALQNESARLVSFALSSANGQESGASEQLELLLLLFRASQVSNR